MNATKLIALWVVGLAIETSRSFAAIADSNGVWMAGVASAAITPQTNMCGIVPRPRIEKLAGDTVTLANAGGRASVWPDKAAPSQKEGVTKLDYTIRLDVLSEGYDGKTQWFAPRVGLIPPKTAVLIMTRCALGDSDVFLSMHDMRSDDLGKTWTKPAPQPTLGRKPYEGAAQVEIIPSDFVPSWHATSGKLLALGATTCY